LYYRHRANDVVRDKNFAKLGEFGKNAQPPTGRLIEDDGGGFDRVPRRKQSGPRAISDAE